MKRPQSSMYQFRRRIPRDIAGKVRGVKLAIPVGERVVHKVVGPKTTEIGFSLGTRDPAEAKSREAEVIAHLDREWEAIRNGPRTLTKRQAVALSGELYHDWIKSAGDDPGSAELWEEVRAVNALAVEGEFGAGIFMLGKDAKRRQSLEERFGPFVDALASRHCIVLDRRSRAMLVEEVAKAMTQAAEQLVRHANSDYRPDPDADRFPQWQPASPSGEGTDTQRENAPNESEAAPVPFQKLVEGRWLEAKAGGASKRTLSAWRTTIRHLTAFLGHDDAARVTKADVVAFKDHRLAEGASTKTVKDGDLAALKSVFGWAQANCYLPTNPAEGITVRIGRKRDQSRPKGFTDEEVAIILTAAMEREPSEREKPKTTAAYRWVPWLLAFTGARVGEICQLRKEDIFEQSGRWVLRITPEAGSVKTGQSRLVPIHSQLIHQGFLEVVRKAGPGHLFVTPTHPSEPQGAVTGLANRMRELIREVVTDPQVQPFHAWRHRFQTVTRELGCDEGLVRVITGHAARDVHDRYGDHTVKAMARVIDAIPSFNLNTNYTSDSTVIFTRRSSERT